MEVISVCASWSVASQLSLLGDQGLWFCTAGSCLPDGDIPRLSLQHPNSEACFDKRPGARLLQRFEDTHSVLTSRHPVEKCSNEQFTKPYQLIGVGESHRSRQWQVPELTSCRQFHQRSVSLSLRKEPTEHLCSWRAECLRRDC